MKKLYRGAGVGSIGLLGGWFKMSGQFRCPKKGEYFLSGAIPEVYRAPNDLPTEYHIMHVTTPPPETIEAHGATYRLQG